VTAAGVTAAAGGQVADAADQVARRAWQVLAVSAGGVFVVFLDATVVKAPTTAASHSATGHRVRLHLRCRDTAGRVRTADPGAAKAVVRRQVTRGRTCSRRGSCQSASSK
jgi:hypothetical protein